jgi:hemerythrin
MATEWTPELTLNHDVLDPQHVALFRLLGEAVSAAEAEEGALLRAVSRFSEALVAHLATEERVMQETLYPERARHKTSHDLLVTDVLGVQSELERGGPTPRLVEIVRSRLPEWLRFHTRVNDVPLGEFLARRGPNPTPLERREGSRKPS